MNNGRRYNSELIKKANGSLKRFVSQHRSESQTSRIWSGGLFYYFNTPVLQQCLLQSLDGVVDPLAELDGNKRGLVSSQPLEEPGERFPRKKTVMSAGLWYSYAAILQCTRSPQGPHANFFYSLGCDDINTKSGRMMGRPGSINDVRWV